MKNSVRKIPLTVSTTDRAYKYVLANKAFSNGYYTALATAIYVALRTRFIIGATDKVYDKVYLNVAEGYNNFSNYNVFKTSSAQTGNGVAIGCMRFSQNALHKIAKFVGFDKSDLRVYFPKTERTAVGKPKFRTVIVGKAKAARAGR
jgi:hypothetical protein